MGDILFSKVTLSLFPHCQFVYQPQLSLNYEVDLVLGDAASFSHDHAEYWDTRQAPHFILPGDRGSSAPVPTLPKT